MEMGGLLSIVIELVSPDVIPLDGDRETGSYHLLLH